MSSSLAEPALQSAYAHCESIARRRLENFPVLSEHLPADRVPHFAAVYAWCRGADDEADESASPAEALEKLEARARELDRIFREGDGDGPIAPKPVAPESLALRATVRTLRLPRKPFDDLLSAFRQDQSKTRYADWDELLDYCSRSAHPVGRLVLGIFEELTGDPARDRFLLEPSDALCTGLQLVNFWQDVARDLRKGRVYLPQESLERHGVRDADLAAPTASAALRACVREACERTAPCFADGAALSDRVSKGLRIPVLAFAIAGDELLSRIAAARYDVLAARPRIGRVHLAKILARAAAARWIAAFRPRRRA